MVSHENRHTLEIHLLDPGHSGMADPGIYERLLEDGVNLVTYGFVHKCQLEDNHGKIQGALVRSYLRGGVDDFFHHSK